MSQLTVLDIKMANKVQQPPVSKPLDGDEQETMPKIESIIVDAALEVAALIDAVCCRCGEWVDWQHYRPLPGISAGSHNSPGSTVRLALAEDIFGLRTGGYIEMRAGREERVIEACGGYYDAYDQPKPVIDGSLRWHEVNHQNVGQVLLMMYDRIFRAYMAREEPDFRLCLEEQGLVRDSWQPLRQPAGQLQNPIRERIRRR